MICAIPGCICSQVVTSSTSIGSTTFVTMSIWRGFAVVRLTPRPRPIDWTRLMLDDWARLQEALIAASFWAFSEEERGAKARIG